jgi:hypothetical protein
MALAIPTMSALDASTAIANLAHIAMEARTTAIASRGSTVTLIDLHICITPSLDVAAQAFRARVSDWPGRTMPHGGGGDCDAGHITNGIDGSFKGARARQRDALPVFAAFYRSR